MLKIYLIAVNAFRGAFSSRLFHGAVLLGVCIFAFVMVVFMADQIVSGDHNSIVEEVMDATVGMIYGYSLILGLIGVLLGSSAISSELSSRTALAVLSRPVERWQFVLGKYLGVLAFLALLYLIGIGFAVVLFYYSGQYPTVISLFVASKVFLMIASFFSLSLALATRFSAPMAFGLTLVYLGMWPLFLVGLPAGYSPKLRIATNIFSYLQPTNFPRNLEELSFGLGTGTVNVPMYSLVLLDNVVYCAILLALGVISFSSRENLVRE